MATKSAENQAKIAPSAPVRLRDQLDRRDLLHAAILGLGVLATSSIRARQAWAAPQFKADPFSLGVASGDPEQDGFVIWTRLAPAPLEVGGGMPRRAVEVSWEIAADETMTRRLSGGVATARPDLSHAVHVEVGGLEPGREYFYRFEVGGIRSQIGRAKTLPAPGREGAVRFAAAGCQRYEDGLFTAWRHIADERLDFVVHYGDYIYEYAAIGAASSRKRPVIRTMPGDPKKCITLDDFRNRYAIYKLDKDLQAAQASTPFLMSFDDHEVENDWAGFHSEQDKVTPKAFASRRAAAFQAWYEHMPLRRRQMPRGPDVLAYRRFEFGRLIRMDVLDTRQHRTPQACGNGWRSCPEAKAAYRTMLGKVQEDWLYAGFKNSNAQWNVLAQQVPIARFDQNGDPTNIETHMDKWDGAEAARTRLFDAAVGAKLKNVVVLGGDVHHNRASELSRNFDDPASRSIGVEFVATSISSGGDGKDPPAKAQKLMSANPHLKFYNNQRGYVRHTVDPARWQADYMVLDKVSKPNQPVTKAAGFVVESGSARLRRN